MTLEKVPRITQVIPATSPEWAPLIWECPYCGAAVVSNITLGQGGRGDKYSMCGVVSFIVVEWVDPPKETPTERVKVI